MKGEITYKEMWAHITRRSTTTPIPARDPRLPVLVYRLGTLADLTDCLLPGT